MALIRPDAWNFPLLVHVLGAMVMVGALILAGSALAFAWRTGSAALVRLGYRALLFGALPGWIVMRAGAQWIASKESLTDSDFTWINVGFTTSDAGLVVIVGSAVLAGLALRRTARGGPDGGGLRWAATVLAGLLVVAYVVTIWAMTKKPI
jgi:hypothetical protein